MRSRVPWWIAPFIGSIVAIVGVSVLLLVVSRPLGEAVGREFAKGLGNVFRRIWIPPKRSPALDIAPGASGYVEALDVAGHQLHFHQTADDVTSIAVEAFWGGARTRIIVGEYDGPPRATVTPPLVRRVAPLVGLAVVRTSAAEVWYADPTRPETEWRCPVAEGGLNILAIPGRLTLRVQDGVRQVVETAPGEMVSCTLGPEGLSIDRRRAPPDAPR